MASELENRLRFILEEKLNDIKPEYIRLGINILGIDGALDTGRLTTEEYNTCSNLASLILQNVPLKKDINLNLSVELDIAENATMRVENKTLFIEEEVAE